MFINNSSFFTSPPEGGVIAHNSSLITLSLSFSWENRHRSPLISLALFLVGIISSPLTTHHSSRITLSLSSSWEPPAPAPVPAAAPAAAPAAPAQSPAAPAPSPARGPSSAARARARAPPPGCSAAS
jgi:hypothetical protein